MDAQERGLLANVIESPDDDTIRLIYADWLHDNDRPERAELIRVQVELARTEEWTPRHAELSAREEALLTPKNLKAWAVSLGFNHYPANFRRGFVERDYFSPSKFMKLAPDIFDRAPLRRVDIGTPVEEESLRDRLIESDLLSRVRELTLYNCTTDRAVVKLTQSRHLGRIEQLKLGGGHAGDALEPIARGRLDGLRRLHLDYDRHPPLTAPRDDGLAALAHSDLAPRLTELLLRGMYLTTAGVAHLASDRWQNLTSLALENNPTDDRGVERLLRSPHLAKWTFLSLLAPGLTGQSVRALADCPGLANLTTLRVEARQVKPRDLAQLLRSPHLARVRDLCLWGVSADAVLKAAASVPETTRLRRLHLGEAYRTLTDTGASILLGKSPLDGCAITFSNRPLRSRRRQTAGNRFARVLVKLGNRIVADPHGL
jgi:uncharacterized protein (TIGR02996 family)